MKSRPGSISQRCLCCLIKNAGEEEWTVSKMDRHPQRKRLEPAFPFLSFSFVASFFLVFGKLVGFFCLRFFLVGENHSSLSFGVINQKWESWNRREK